MCICETDQQCSTTPIAIPIVIAYYLEDSNFTKMNKFDEFNSEKTVCLSKDIEMTSSNICTYVCRNAFEK